MLVYKFGGGVLKDGNGLRQMANIINSHKDDLSGEGLVVVVSALGKMTNAFEILWRDWISDKINSKSFNIIKSFHKDIISGLCNDRKPCEEILESLSDEIVDLIGSPPPEDNSEAYDKLVVYGEILSSRIISAYLSELGINNKWLDTREVIKTDSTFREAKVNWGETHRKLKQRISEDIHQDSGNSYYIWVTQGFIGSDNDSRSTTLGREGSDFTAAIYGHVLKAKKVVVWKDVPGVMTMDPSQYDDSSKMDQISYLEAIELSYFGAKILHPNTIKPLENLGIPLEIRPIIDPEASGTKVFQIPYIGQNEPVVITKANQVLISLQPRDFSFIMENALSNIFATLSRFNIRVNLLQHGAVSLSFCIDYNEDNLQALIGDFKPEFKVLYNIGVDLLTIRHYSEDVIRRLTKGKRIFVHQQSRKTARFVLS